MPKKGLSARLAVGDPVQEALLAGKNAGGHRDDGGYGGSPRQGILNQSAPDGVNGWFGKAMPGLCPIAANVAWVCWGLAISAVFTIACRVGYGLAFLLNRL